jgi:hypothetical protein
MIIIQELWTFHFLLEVLWALPLNRVLNAPGAQFPSHQAAYFLQPVLRGDGRQLVSILCTLTLHLLKATVPPSLLLTSYAFFFLF